MTREQAVAKAQREADRDGRPIVVLNLNPFNPLWVLREYNERVGVIPGSILVRPTA